MDDEARSLISVGWREWVALPELGIKQIKAKVDTGARTSAIHTESIEVFHDERGNLKVKFSVLPLQGKSKRKTCEAKIVDRRIVSDSGGHRELRWVIESLIKVGSRRWPIELTLTNRESMRFRMLLGRTALKGCCVYPDKSYLNLKLTKKKKKKSRR